MQHKKDREQLEEEMRILYVATTRAQNEMVIVDSIRAMERYQRPLTSAAIYSRCGYTGWLLRAFFDSASPLFTTRLIHEPFDLTPLKQVKQNAYYTLRRHAKQSVSLETATASSRKQTHSFPAFSLTDQEEGAKRGTLLHEIVSQLTPPFSPEKIEELFAKAGRVMQPWDLQQLCALGDNERYQLWHTFPNVFHELPYSVKLQGQLLYGYIDFLAMDEEHIIVLDYKSDHLSAPEQFLSLYEEQLRTYAQAMHTIYPTHHIETWIYSFHLAALIPLS